MSEPIAAHAHAIIELDNCDALRQSLGEVAIELVLEEFSSRLGALKRRGDGLFTLSENRYCLVWRGVTQRQHVNLAMAKLYRKLAVPCEVLGQMVPLVVHTGIALPHAGSGGTAKSMLASAQIALRKAKATAQPHVIFSDSEASANREDPAAALRLQQAIDMGEFVVYFQPKVQAGYGTLIGAEALVRWHDAQRKKVIPPGGFIEEIERSELIWPLTLYVIKNSIARCAQWPSALSVSVNVPPKLLVGSTLLTSITDALTIADLEPQRLILEVTERGDLPPGALEVLAQIAAAGIKIAIDDFGTGQASLLQFRDMPASVVKIDRTFVAAAGESSKDQAIIRGIVDLAHHCKMHVVAEGVEDAACAELMKNLGCDWLQGYWFGKAVPHDAFYTEYLQPLGPDSAADHALVVLDG